MDIRRYELLKATGELPSPRGLALKIIDLTQADDVSVAALTRAIRADPAFAGRLIKAANSARGEHGRPVASVEDALLVLGLNAVRGLALGFSLLEHYRRGKCEAFDYGHFWTRSLLLGLSVQTLVRWRGVIGTDEAFSLGLVVRVGELALATLYPQGFARVLESGPKNVNEQFSAEQNELGINHAELSAAMLADWGMPEVLVKAALFQQHAHLASHSPGVREKQLIEVLQLASALVDTCLASEAQRSGLTRELLMLAADFDLDAGQILSWCEQIFGSWEEWRTLLGLEGGQFSPAAELLCAIGDAEAAEVEAEAEQTSGLPEDAASSASAGTVMPLAVLACLSAAQQDQLVGTLKACGWRVKVIDELAEVVGRFLVDEPELLIIDLNAREGVLRLEQEEVTRNLRQMRRGEMVYVLGLLERLDEAEVLASLEAGVDDILLMPVVDAVLRARLQTALRLRGLQGRLREEQEELKAAAAALMISNRRLEEAAMTDVLTGLPNRRYAVERMQAEWTAAVRGLRGLGVMIIDLDNFKHINDQYGHAVGDLVLRRISQALRAGLRGEDVICRTGGDEFLVICPHGNLEATMHCAERVRVLAQAMQVSERFPALRVSTSIGVAVWMPGMKDIDALLKLADQGAYLAKNRGRDSVVALQHEPD